MNGSVNSNGVPKVMFLTGGVGILKDKLYSFELGTIVMTLFSLIVVIRYRHETK